MAMSAIAVVNYAKKAVRFPRNSSGEEELIADREQCPQTAEIERPAPVVIHHRAEEGPVHWIINVDLSVTEVSDE